MTCRGALGSLVAVSLLLLGSRIAGAAPGDCLAYRDNPHVAACANQYGQPGAAGQQGVARPRAPQVVATTPSAPVSGAVQVIADAELKSVPVVVGVKAAQAPAPVPETPTFTVDSQVLTNTVIIGAVAGSLLILVALGAWRWGSSLLRDCPWCSSRISRSAHTCPRCFRAL
jgi:hypothetical protein